MIHPIRQLDRAARWSNRQLATLEGNQRQRFQAQLDTQARTLKCGGTGVYVKRVAVKRSLERVALTVGTSHIQYRQCGKAVLVPVYRHASSSGTANQIEVFFGYYFDWRLRVGYSMLD